MADELYQSLQIILITYNRVRKLEKTFKQIFAEDSPLKDLDITVIDNNSTDNTEEIVKNFQVNFPNLHYKKNKYNIGANANIMKAFYEADKEYVWVLADNDDYCFDDWNTVREAIRESFDAIVVAKYDYPQIGLSQLLVQATFLPGVIYKTSNIDDTVMGNMAFSISNMFPHIALFSKLINENKKIKIVDKSLVHLGNNIDEDTGEYVYTRGYEDSALHPYLKDMSWMAGYANALQMIKNKKLRELCVNNKLFLIPLNSSQIFFINEQQSGGSLFNLMNIFCVLNFRAKIHFLLNWLLYISLYRIVYVYYQFQKDKDENSNYYYKRYRIRLFSLIKTKLFKVKIKIKRDKE